MKSSRSVEAAILALSMAHPGCWIDSIDTEREPAIHTEAIGTSYFVKPSGSGSSCSTAAPCSLDSGMSMAGPGDDVVLIDGVYGQTFTTKRSGTVGVPITIRAQNRHLAVIRKASGHLTNIPHNHLIIRGIRFDGQRPAGRRAAFESAT